MKFLISLFLLISSASAQYFAADIVEGKIDSSFAKSLSTLPDTSWSLKFRQANHPSYGELMWGIETYYNTLDEPTTHNVVAYGNLGTTKYLSADSNIISGLRKRSSNEAMIYQGDSIFLVASYSDGSLKTEIYVNHPTSINTWNKKATLNFKLELVPDHIKARDGELYILYNDTLWTMPHADNVSSLNYLVDDVKGFNFDYNGKLWLTSINGNTLSYYESSTRYTVKTGTYLNQESFVVNPVDTTFFYINNVQKGRIYFDKYGNQSLSQKVVVYVTDESLNIRIDKNNDIWFDHKVIGDVISYKIDSDDFTITSYGAHNSGWISTNSFPIPGTGLHIDLDNPEYGYAGKTNIYYKLHLNQKPNIMAWYDDSVTYDDEATKTISYMANLQFKDDNVNDDHYQFKIEGPSWITLDSSTNGFSMTEPGIDSGTYTVKVFIRDNFYYEGEHDKNMKDTLEWSFQVYSSNDFPVIGSSPALSCSSEVVYNYDVNATDNNTLTYSLDVNPTGMSINSSTGLIEWTPAHSDTGDHDVSVNVTDNLGATSIQDYVLTVLFGNKTPVINSIPDSIGISNELYSYDVEASDGDGVLDILTYSLEQNPIGMTINSSTGLIEWSPTDLEVGVHTVEVKVQDTLNTFATQLYSLEILIDNDIPEITTDPDTSVKPEEVYSQLFSVTDTSSSLTWNVLDKPSWLAFNGSTLSGTGLNVISGTSYNVSLEVTDGEKSDTITYDIIVENVFPTVIIEFGQTFNIVLGDTFNFQFSAIDLNNDELLYTMLGGPTEMNINSSTGLVTWIPTEVISGMFGVKADDQHGGYVGGGHVYNVILNTPPTITSTPSTMIEKENLYSYDVDAIDSNGHDITYSLNIKPSGMTINSNTGLVEWTPTINDTGIHTIEVMVKDTKNDSAIQNYNLEVIFTNTAPTISSISDTTSNEDESYIHQIDALDEDGHQLTYSLNDYPNGMTITSSGLIEWFPVQANVGVHNIEVKVKDEPGDSAIQTYILEVINVNDIPEISSLPDTMIFEDANYSYSIIAFDDDNDLLTYSLIEFPNGMTLNSNIIEWTTTQDNVGDHNIKIKVEDINGDSAIQEYILHVVNINDAPIILLSMKDTTINEKDTLEYSVSIQDVDDTNHTVKWFVNNQEEKEGKKFTFITNYKSAGTDTVKVTVSDNDTIVEEQFVIVINNINRAPIISNLDTTIIIELGDTINYSLDVLDKDGDELVYNFSSESSIINLLNDSIFIIIPEFLGHDTIVLNVSDNDTTISYNLKIRVKDKIVSILENINRKNSLTIPSVIKSTTVIRYSIKTHSNVKMFLYNTNGKLVKTVLDRKLRAGNYNMSWNHLNSNNSITSGNYILLMTIGNSFKITKKIIVIE